MERWYSHSSRTIYIVGHFSLDTTFGYFCLRGSGVRVRCFCLGICEGSVLIQSGKWEGHDLFRKKKIKNASTHPPQ